MFDDRAAYLIFTGQIMRRNGLYMIVLQGITQGYWEKRVNTFNVFCVCVCVCLCVYVSVCVSCKTVFSDIEDIVDNVFSNIEDIVENLKTISVLYSDYLNMNCYSYSDSLIIYCFWL